MFFSFLHHPAVTMVEDQEAQNTWTTVETSCNGDATGKTKNYYLVDNFATRVRVRAQQ